MTNQAILAAALTLLGSQGCGRTDDMTGPGPLLDQLPRSLTAAETGLIDAGNRFTLDLFREAAGTLPQSENAFLSPFSASMALGMALNGAAGMTLDSMRATLRFGDASLADINTSYRNLLQLYQGLDPRGEMLIANSVWIDEGFPVRHEFLEAARTWFDARAATLDLQGPDALDAINGWVREKTQNRIPTLLDEIQDNEIAFLVNAIYFKGRWRIPFDPRRTQPNEFRNADGSRREVPTMWLDERLRYTQREDFQAVDLLYGNGAFAMTVLLPGEGRTPAAVLAQLTPSVWRELVGSFQEAKIMLGLPRFTLDYRRDLIPDLKGLGMGIAFDAQRADFSGIADVAPERLYLTTVLQKTFVEVNEEGTEAAAATAVGVGVTSAPPSLVVDRPFLFLIRERLSGGILFVGLVNTLGS